MLYFERGTPPSCSFLLFDVPSSRATLLANLLPLKLVVILLPTMFPKILSLSKDPRILDFFFYNRRVAGIKFVFLKAYF